MAKRRVIESPGRTRGIGQRKLDFEIQKRNNPFNRIFQKFPRGHPTIKVRPGTKTPRGRIV